MQLFSSYESLSWLLERFADKLVEIETSITTWRQDDRIRANILAGDGWATNPACLTIIVNVQAMNSAMHVITSKESLEVQHLMSKGMGMPNHEWLDVLNARKEVDCPPVEYQLRVVLNSLAVSRKRVREFLDDHLWRLLQSGALGPQGRTALEYYTGFHLAHLEGGFLMLQAVLVHGLDQRDTDILVWSQRIEQLVFQITSSLMAPTEGAEA
jgi:hypothetical protein